MTSRLHFALVLGSLAMGNVPDREEDGEKEGAMALPPQLSEEEVNLAKRTFAMDLCRLRETIKQR